MQIRKVVILLTLLISAIFLSVFIVFNQNAQNKTAADDQEPTIIQDGLMSERQKKHSKLYRQPEESRSLIKKVDKDLTIIIGEPWHDDTSIGGILPTQEEYLGKVACEATSIVSGTVKAKFSQLTEDSKSVFTDYDFEIADIFKNSSKVNLQKGDVITVTRSGGVIKLNGRIIRVYDKSFKFLKIGASYLLFLSYLTDAETFKPSDGEGTFEISGKKVERFNNTSQKFQLNNKDGWNDFANFLEMSSSRCYQ